MQYMDVRRHKIQFQKWMSSSRTVHGCVLILHPFLPVIPAQAGIQFDFEKLPRARWIPACAGMTETGMLDRHPCVYILASRERGTLYVGVTSDLIKRIWEHKNDLVDGFTKRYRVHTLVWYEQHESMTSAISREKAIKEWKHAWKIELVETTNPRWRDLYPDITENGFRLAPE